jgi:hypothetical protein
LLESAQFPLNRFHNSSTNSHLNSLSVAELLRCTTDALIRRLKIIKRRQLPDVLTQVEIQEGHPRRHGDAVAEATRVTRLDEQLDMFPRTGVRRAGTDRAR